MSTMSRRDQNRQVALNASAAGLLVVPLKPDKTPYIKWRGLTTTNAPQVKTWWNAWPDAIPGIITKDVMAIDSDRHGETDGVAAWNLLVEGNGALPEHPVTLTPNDGEHHFFRMPDGERLGNGRGTLPDGIDVRGVGGYVVAPGAILPDGREWRSAPGAPSLYDAYKSGNGALPCAPEWLLNEVRKHKQHGAEPASNNGRYSFDDGKITKRQKAFAETALNNICAELRAMPPKSGRNIALNGGAYRLGRMAVLGWIDAQVAFTKLREACRKNGLMDDDPRKVEQTFQSGWQAGLRDPHPVLEDRPYNRSADHGARAKWSGELKAQGSRHDEVRVEVRETDPDDDVPPVNGHAQPNGEDRAVAGEKAKGKGDGGVRRTQATTLIAIATRDGVELFHSPDRTAYADINVKGHRETWALKSMGFRFWLRHVYYEETGGAPNSDAMSTAMGVIEARAYYDGEMRDVHLRVAEQDDKIYLDLCDDDWRAVEIDDNGWRIMTTPPVRFRRTRGMLAIPTPEKDAKVAELRDHLNVDETSFVLIVSWLLAVLAGRGPYPILALTGEQGTGKSLTADMLRSILDPHTASLRSLPRDTRDLYVAAMNGHILVFDNLSGITPEISDCLCRLSTGGGFATRSLYTDGDEVLFNGQRPIALTSITDVANRSDLADRLMIVKLMAIAANARLSEHELRAKFEKARPRLVGALLNVVAHGLKQLPSTRLNRLPRMADFALWMRACETAMWTAGMHMAAYEANRTDAVDVVLDDSEVATALRQHMDSRHEDTTTAKDLLNDLNLLVTDYIRRKPKWPTTARGLSGQLTRLAPALRRVGIAVTHSAREGGTGRRILTITKTEEKDES